MSFALVDSINSDWPELVPDPSPCLTISQPVSLTRDNPKPSHMDRVVNLCTFLA
ncbi:hypothetical protein FOCG_06538 [Fusarium oxysporum f. sp. radicis-lycopersici 26381]|uniref:Uncharacterized protein n=1 Tax=Fusarium oxysporum Fo47 TaxID=660027 RepID=W9KYJ0_FUSOX|nr:hypothetical protein FOZG_03598 [Fusarium oxysporum Fo47]EXL53133.1 hypothetical protein FOCG_06538 [Fusarium oxysporum f. sp. radicis-lycopersici 26381]